MTNGSGRTPRISKEILPARGEYNLQQETSLPKPDSSVDDLTTLEESKVSDIPPPVPGFLGSTSFSAVFTEGQNDFNLKDLPRGRDFNIRGSNQSKLPSMDSVKVQEGAEVLSCLAEMLEYAPTLLRCCHIESVDEVAPYVRDCIPMMSRRLKNERGHQDCFISLSYKIFQETSTPSPFESQTRLADLPSLYMGRDPCWEIVGLMLATLGLGAISMDEVNIVDEDLPPADWKSRAQGMVRASDRCISFCEEDGHLTTASVTLIFKNFILYTQVYGDAGCHPNP